MPGIDVDVRIELLHPHAQAALFEQHADRRAGEPLAQRADDAAGDENVFGHADFHPALEIISLSNNIPMNAAGPAQNAKRRNRPNEHSGTGCR